jgi:tryptophanyl-tRNA synthetase
MAHDVVGYEEVCVGEDQEQHLEYCRKLIEKHNEVFNTSFRIPKTRIVVGRIKDLRDSAHKMSKSRPNGCLFLDDAPDKISRKIAQAITDEEGLKNLHFLHSEFVGDTIPPESNAFMKRELADAIINVFESMKNP